MCLSVLVCTEAELFYGEFGMNVILPIVNRKSVDTLRFDRISSIWPDANGGGMIGVFGIFIWLGIRRSVSHFVLSRFSIAFPNSTRLVRRSHRFCQPVES